MKTSGFSKIIISVCTVNIIVFTACVLYLNYTGHNVDSVLILCFFAVFGLEYASLASIKKAKINSPVDIPQVETEEESSGQHAKN